MRIVVLALHFELSFVTEYEECFTIGMIGLSCMSGFVEMVVNNFAKINECAFLNLNFDSCIQLKAGCMNESDISHIVVSIYLANHELSLPQFLVIGNMIVSSFSFTHFEESAVTIESNFDVL